MQSAPIFPRAFTISSIATILITRHIAARRRRRPEFSQHASAEYGSSRSAAAKCCRRPHDAGFIFMRMRDVRCAICLFADMRFAYFADISRFSSLLRRQGLHAPAGFALLIGEKI